VNTSRLTVSILIFFLQIIISASNIITAHVIINRDTHAMLNDFLQKLKSLHNQQCYNILNNLIYYHKLISVDVTYATLSGEVYKSAHQHYNILFNAELVDEVARAIYVKDICDYEEFCIITQKMKSLKSAFNTLEVYFIFYFTCYYVIYLTIYVYEC